MCGYRIVTSGMSFRTSLASSSSDLLRHRQTPSKNQQEDDTCDAGRREWGWLRDGAIPLRFQGVSQLSCVQTNNKKEQGRPAPKLSWIGSKKGMATVSVGRAPIGVSLRRARQGV